MLGLALVAQLAVLQSSADSAYASAALRILVSQAASANRRLPDSLAAYTSRIETEMSLLVRDSLGREHTADVEQLASAATWTRDGRYDLHVLGYRSQNVGMPYSTLTMVKTWTVPSLYGERLSFGVSFGRGRRARDSLVAVHPFAADRDQYYEFSGGDTVTTLHVGARAIPIVRVRVRPRPTALQRYAAFDGDIDLDADRKQIVRMRGQLVTMGRRRSLTTRVAQAAMGVTAAAFIEFTNAEVDGRYWLPASQRTEFQAEFGLFGEGRPVFRIVSSIREINVTNQPSGDVGPRPARPTTISWAPRDSMDGFTGWRTAQGTLSSEVHADDFIDLAPDKWRPTGPPRVDFFPATSARILRFNRVEGPFVGVAPSVDFRSAAPGLTIGALGGWAFTEQTARGGAFVRYQHSVNQVGARVERVLTSTTDFALPMSSDPGVSALLFSIDDNDYVDRSVAMTSFTRTLGTVSTGLITMQAGAARDRPEHARLSHGLFVGDGFRENRGVRPGDYLIASTDIEFHPNVTGDFVAPGIGARLHSEAADGDLDWQRTELSLSARRYFGRFALAAHADGGVVTGDTPPQQLFELGGIANLPGYAYKSFVGDRAALLRSFATYRFGLFTKPVRLRNYMLPAVNPGLAASISGGWTELSNTAARAAAQELGSAQDGTPVSVPTHGIRATAGAGLTFFSDLLHLGVARPLDHLAAWQFTVGFGTAF